MIVILIHSGCRYRLEKKQTILNSSMVPSTNLWFFLSVEFLIGTAISAILAVLNAIKLFLPKPPRDLTGDVVLVSVLLVYSRVEIEPTYKYMSLYFEILEFNIHLAKCS